MRFTSYATDYFCVVGFRRSGFCSCSWGLAEFGNKTGTNCESTLFVLGFGTEMKFGSASRVGGRQKEISMLVIVIVTIDCCSNWQWGVDSN
jgi:hypothetical protein